jgi:hypothetical protein
VDANNDADERTGGGMQAMSPSNRILKAATKCGDLCL